MLYSVAFSLFFLAKAVIPSPMTELVNKAADLAQMARRLGADGVDCLAIGSAELSCAERLGQAEGLERSESQAIGLRVFMGQRSAAASSEDLSHAALQQMAERAVAMAKLAPPDPHSKQADAAQFARACPELELADRFDVDEAWLTEQATLCEDAARSVAGITNSEGAEASASRSHVALVIDNGKQLFSHDYHTTRYSLSVSVLAGKDTAMERDYDFSSARHRHDVRKAQDIGKEAARRTLARLHPRKIKSCSVPVVFDPRVGKQLLSTLAGAISGSAIARGSSFLKGDLGNPIFAPSITIVDDPHRVRGLSSKPFDAEGIGTTKRAMVERGVLQSWFLDIRTASKLGLTTTGHATRGLASAPAPSATNLYMEAGALSPAELMADIKEGLYITDTFGMGINIVTGDYSQGASGFWIENGEIAYPVSEITIAGHLREMFKTATPANDLAFHYGINTPSLKIEHMTVAGT